MTEIAVGKPFPTPTRREEGIAPIITGDSFGVICQYSGLTDVEIQDWKSAPVQYGLLIHQDVPCVSFRIGRWSFDFTLNIVAEPERKRQDFIAGIGNLVTLYLLAYPSRVVKAIRGIGFDHRLMEGIRQASLAQRSELEVKNVESILRELHPSDIWQQSTIVRIQ